MTENTEVTIAFHPADAALVEDLQGALLRRAPELRLRARSAPFEWDARDAVANPLVVMLSPNMSASDDQSWLAAVIKQAAAARSLVLVSLRGSPPRDLSSRYGVIDLSGWNMAPIEYELGQLITQIRSWVPMINLVLFDDLTVEMFSEIADLPLTAATAEILRLDNMIYVGDLVSRTEAEILRMPEADKATIDEIGSALRRLDLRLGMNSPGWPPEDFEATLANIAAANRAALLRQLPGGATFEPAGDRFSMVADAAQGDLEAALRPMVGQMQNAILDKARNFAGLAVRVDNQPGWNGLSRSAGMLVELLDRPAAGVPTVLGHLYPTALEIGSFVELDQQLSAGAASYAAPLDPEVRRVLTDLVRSLAPWLRSFPSVRQADEDASRFLVEAAALQPVVQVIDVARETDLLETRDLETFRQLERASARGAFQGAKAAGVARRSGTNLVVVVVGFWASLMLDAVVSDFATTSPLAHKAGQFLVRGEKAIERMAKDMAPDLRHAIRDVQRRLDYGAGELRGASPEEWNEAPPQAKD
ncbi:hypothetical protein [Sphingomonas sp. CLY1604]|uniref:hypothetical protein n=1 Tax=Sphingomonas sp. CLY1604 TaxID=3457786 RepID=UPI003FD8E411